MLGAYFNEIAIIVLPICIYQIWTFIKSFNQIPFRTLGMGLYGGICAILCQLSPVHIFGQIENFQCVPVILSILYGKRRAGIVSIAILAAYQVFAFPSGWVPPILGILVYSVMPLLLCRRFERYHRRMRLVVALALSMATIVVELLFLAIFFVLQFGRHGLTILMSHYGNMLGVASMIQIMIMGISFYLLEIIIENGRVRHRCDSLVKYNPVGICAFDMQNRFTSVNAAYEAITGYSASELLGKSRLKVWFNQDHHVADELLDSLQRGEIQHDVEVTIRHRDGRALVIRCTLVPMMEDGKMVGFFGMVTDLTEAKLAEEALRSADKLSVVGQMAAGIAHEIRNPLTALMGFLKLLPDADDPSRYLTIMQDEMTRIELIVSELLVLAKPQALEFSVKNIKQKLLDVLHLLGSQASMKSIQLVTHIDDGVPSIECEANQLKQVFINVIKNAIEATNEGGTVSVDLHSLTDSQIIVRVIDDGPGIPQDKLARIGEPFFTTKSSGTGLGMMMCKKIITNHHGKLDISSESGKGTTVSITLPIRQLDDADERVAT